jgi:hypothetical protein
LRVTRWMDEAELAKVGVTTGMRKVLARATTQTATLQPSRAAPKGKASKAAPTKGKL